MDTMKNKLKLLRSLATDISMKMTGPAPALDDATPGMSPDDVRNMAFGIAANHVGGAARRLEYKLTSLDYTAKNVAKDLDGPAVERIMFRNGTLAHVEAMTCDFWHITTPHRYARTVAETVAAAFLDAHRDVVDEDTSAEGEVRYRVRETEKKVR